MVRDAMKFEWVIVIVPLAAGGTRSGLVPWQTDRTSYVPGRLSDTATTPPWKVSHGAGAVGLSPPQATTASTTQHDHTLMGPPACAVPLEQTYGAAPQNDRTAGCADGSA